MFQAMLATGLSLLGTATLSNAYWLMAMENTLTQQRLDPVVDPGKVSGHVHTIFGGSNFGITTNTSALRASECTTTPIPQDKSAYWHPSLYFEWANGSFSSVEGDPVIYYLFDDPADGTTEFPEDFRMVSGNPTLRTGNDSSFAQQAVSFLCLDFSGTSTKYDRLPPVPCPSGIRAQINFQSCWDGKNADSADHQSHVAYKSGGPDVGTCSDPKYPVTLPRIFMEVYLQTPSFDAFRSQAKNATQPYVYSYGDATGFGYHADYMYGWDKGVLQKAIDGCNCDNFGDPTCCKNAGIFDLKPSGETCAITNTVDEQTTGTLDKLPGNNPVQPEGHTATLLEDPSVPALLAPVFVYTGGMPTATGKIVVSATTAAVVPATTVAKPSSATTTASPSIVVPATTIAKPSSVAAAATATAATPNGNHDSQSAVASQVQATTSSLPSSTGSVSASCMRKKKRNAENRVMKRHLGSHRHARAMMKKNTF